MPVISDKKDVSAIKESQNCCKACYKKASRVEPIFICDVCSDWLCRNCSGISDILYELASKADVKINFVCKLCDEQLPKVRDLLKLSLKQQEMEEEIANLKTNVEKNTTLISEQSKKSEDMKNRLEKIEKLVEKNKLDDEGFPSLPNIDAATKSLAEQLSSQLKTTTKLDEELQKQQQLSVEEKRQAARAANLIIYGLPENIELDEKEQMKADFKLLQDILSDRVELSTKDFNDMRRLGANNGKPRPLRVTFTSLEKRKEVLTNNMGLIINDDKFDNCPCRTNPGRHVHINITNDKTPQQRENEAKLREELKERRKAGENVKIKQGKIVNKISQNTHARWVDLFEDGSY